MPFSHRGHEVNTIVVDRRAISFSSEYHAQSLLGGRHRQVNIAARGAHGRRDGRGRARRRSARCIAAVVRHVCLDKVASGQSGTQAKLSRKHGGGDNARQLPRVLARVARMRAPDAKHLQHRRLRLQNRTTANRADLNRGHRH